jgi:hypothetical protein
MTLLSAIADGWPALRAHFGDQLLTRLSEDPQFNHDNGMTWNYLALVADRQQLLSLARRSDVGAGAACQVWADWSRPAIRTLRM